MSDIERIGQIPGVGAKLAKKLIATFGSEDAAIKAIVNAQVATLAGIPGVGKRKAMSIVQEAYTIREGISVYEVLKTEDAKALYHRVLEIIQSYANSLFAKDKLSLYYPLPSSKVDVIRSRLDWFSQAANLIKKCKKEQIETLGQFLSGTRPLRRGSVPAMATWRVILTDNDQFHEKLKRLGADKTSRLIRLKAGEQISEYLKSYDYVIGALDVEGMTSAAEHASNFEPLKTEFGIADVSPESIISFYATNHDTIVSVCAAAEILRKLPSTPELQIFLDKLDINILNDLATTVKRITSSGDMAEGSDQEFDRLRTANRTFETAISETEIWANDKIRDEISSSQVVLEGDQIIRILEASSGESIGAEQLRQYLPPQVFEILIKALQDSEDRLAKLLELQRNELEWVDGIFSQNVVLPIQANRQHVSNFQNNIRRSMHAREHKLKKEIAHQLVQYEQAIKDAVQTLLDFDLFQAVGQFARDYQLAAPILKEEGVGLAFQNGKNLFLAKQAFIDGFEVKPVSYKIGQTQWKPEGTEGERVILLSGANSGGKSCLLQNVGQVVILAQMGMPVPAEEAEVFIFDEFYYYTKAVGMLSAGAFESSLTNLAQIVMSDSPKLACFDEWEASTEPGAAAKVVAAILELFFENPNSCVIFVSHLAEDITELTRVPIRVDGIEASGLDDGLNLIVDRSPQFGKIAKSTPELIVERLYRSS
ncbi:MAG: helix-hairpin-helix domain-containing protein, partial [Promethearchaeota archaeon]